MKSNLFVHHLTLVVAIIAVTAIANRAVAQNSGPRNREGLSKPVHRVAQKPNQVSTNTSQAAVQQHPLDPALKIAYRVLDNIDKNVKDYTCTLIKRERIKGVLSKHSFMYCKIRNKPLSCYMYFAKPSSVKGREVVYVAGRNNGKLTAHEGGLRGSLLPTVSIAPTSLLAMRNERYPITEIGIRNLIWRLIEVGEQDRKYGECEVKFFKNAKVGKRVCTCLQVTHPVPRKNFRFNIARIYLDDELQIPIRYEAYSWPKEKGGKPILLEEYTYMNIKLNVGLTNADFDIKNPNYKFK